MVTGDDHGLGKVFWIVAGCVITGLVGIPLARLVDVLTPKPKFEIAVTETAQVTATNLSSHSPAKNVVVTIKAEGAPAAAISSADSRCRANTPAAKTSGFYETFECTLINPSDRRQFDVEGLPDRIQVDVEYEGYSSSASFVKKTTRTSKLIRTQQNWGTLTAKPQKWPKLQHVIPDDGSDIDITALENNFTTNLVVPHLTYTTTVHYEREQ